MKKFTILLSTGAMLLTTLGLIGCADMNTRDVGTLTGTAVGALVGSRFGAGSGQMLAVAGGAVAGAFLGGQIGKTMDENDALKMQQSLEHTKTNKTARWRNPDNGNVYELTPTRTFKEDKEPCRDYVTTAFIGGKKEKVHGTACRDDNGHWVSQS